jgi:hypothetical protein
LIVASIGLSLLTVKFYSKNLFLQKEKLMRFLKHTRTLLTFAFLLVIAACSQVPTPNLETFVAGENAADVVHEVTTTAVLAQVEQDGRTFTFIDESTVVKGGSVGILETTSAGQGAWLPTLNDMYPTALEVFLAVAPKEMNAPRQLLENHNRLASLRSDLSVEPRAISLPISRQSNLVGPLTATWCQDGPTFKNNFHNWFFVGMNYGHEGYGLDLWGTKYGVTGVASRRILAACNNETPYTYATVAVHIQAQIGANIWAVIPGTYRVLGSQTGMYYLSDGWTAQRYRIRAQGHHYTTYNLAGAWGTK